MPMRKKVDPATIQMWREYKRTEDIVLRNHLLEKYLPLVRYIAERMLAKLPQNINVEDLQSAGVLGLLDAVRGFDPERGVKFETYCSTRIRGSILDELRSLDWVPRIVRSKANKIDRAWKALEARYGRTPSDEEMADQLELTLPEYEAMAREASAVTMTSLTAETKADDGGKSMNKLNLLEDKKGLNPEVELKKKEVTEFLTRGLNRKERLIILLYYYEELTMREIGEALDLSESRVCQLHSRIIIRLKSQMQKFQIELMS
jgi:RNA polymerase sigma factor for flagellar operon FliA